MFCQNCGKKLDDNANFCPECGQKVLRAYTDTTATKTNTSQISSVCETVLNAVDEIVDSTAEEITNAVDEVKESAKDTFQTTSEKIDTKTKEIKKVNIYTFLTKKAVDRETVGSLFLTILCFLLATVILKLIDLLCMVLGAVLPYYVVSNIFIFYNFVQKVIQFVSIILTIFAATAVSYRMVADAEKDKNNILELAFLFLNLATLLLHKYKPNLFVPYCVLVIVCLAGLAYFGGIIYLGDEVTGDIEISKLIERIKTKFAEEKQIKAEKAAENKKENVKEEPVHVEPRPFSGTGVSYFDGDGGQLLGKIIVCALVSLITCGIATPFFLVKIIEWKEYHTVIDGRRRVFNGTGGQLWGLWIKWWFLSLITCGIYAYFAIVDFFKWEAKHTSFEGDIAVEGIYQNSYFDGNSFECIGYLLLTGVLISLSCGFAYPWMLVKISEWKYKNTVCEGRRLILKAEGGQYFGTWFVNQLLTAITCGIYSSWAVVRENKFLVSHLHTTDNYR